MSVQLRKEQKGDITHESNSLAFTNILAHHGFLTGSLLYDYDGRGAALVEGDILMYPYAAAWGKKVPVEGSEPPKSLPLLLREHAISLHKVTVVGQREPIFDSESYERPLHVALVHTKESVWLTQRMMQMEIDAMLQGDPSKKIHASNCKGIPQFDDVDWIFLENDDHPMGSISALKGWKCSKKVSTSKGVYFAIAICVVAVFIVFAVLAPFRPFAVMRHKIGKCCGSICRFRVFAFCIKKKQAMPPSSTSGIEVVIGNGGRSQTTKSITNLRPNKNVLSPLKTM